MRFEGGGHRSIGLWETSNTETSAEVLRVCLLTLSTDAALGLKGDDI